MKAPIYTRENETKWKRTGQYRNCLMCGKEKYVFPTNFNKRTFCSVPCYMEYRKKFQNGRAYVTEKNPFEGRKHSQDSIDRANEKKRELYLKFGSPYPRRLWPRHWRFNVRKLKRSKTLGGNIYV